MGYFFVHYKINQSFFNGKAWVLSSYVINLQWTINEGIDSNNGERNIDGRRVVVLEKMLTGKEFS